MRVSQKRTTVPVFADNLPDLIASEDQRKAALLRRVLNGFGIAIVPLFLLTVATLGDWVFVTAFFSLLLGMVLLGKLLLWRGYPRAAAANLVRVPLYPRNRRAAHEHMLGHTGCRAVVVSESHAEALTEIDAAVPSIELVLVRDGGYEDWLATQRDLQLVEPARRNQVQHETVEDFATEQRGTPYPVDPDRSTIHDGDVSRSDRSRTGHQLRHRKAAGERTAENG